MMFQSLLNLSTLDEQIKQATLYKKFIQQWMEPEHPWERKLAQKISKLKTVPLIQFPPFEMEYMRMKPSECHLNCQWYCDQKENEGQWEHVVGWIVMPDYYILHSMLRHRAGADRSGKGILRCITPFLFPQQQLHFALDPKIHPAIWDSPEGRRMKIEREGLEGICLNPGVRKMPQAFLRKEMERMKFYDGLLGEFLS